MTMTMFNTRACFFRALLAAVAIVSPVFAGGPMKAIVGGVESTVGQFPYFVHYRYCGGALIAPDIVLTAAHCDFDGEDDLYVSAYERGETTGGAQVRQSVELVNHTLWEDDGSYKWDFALIKLNEPVTIDESFVTLELNDDPAFPSDDSNFIVMGLGNTVKTPGDSNTSPSDDCPADILKNLTKEVMGNDECRSVGGWGSRLTDYMLCGIDPEREGEDNGQGDSGGPIVVRSYQGDGTFKDILVGVTSWGSFYPCDGEVCPAVYARTSSAVDWIRTTACETLNSVADFCPQSPTTSTTPSPTPSTPPAPTSSSKSEKKSSKKSKSGKKTKSTKAPTRAPTAAPTKTSKKTKKS